jgi:hypothetical protein
MRLISEGRVKPSTLESAKAALERLRQLRLLQLRSGPASLRKSRAVRSK